MRRGPRTVYLLASAAIALAGFGALSLHAEQPAASGATAGKPTGTPVAEAEERDRPLVLGQAAHSLQWSPCPAIFPPGCHIAVLHGDPGKPGADIFFRVPADYTIPAHWHTSRERMVLVAGTLDVTYAGHPTARLETGDYAYGPAKLPHVAHCRGATPCVLFIAFEDAVDAHPFEGDIPHGAQSR